MAKQLRIGRFVKCTTTGESFKAYIPSNLPPEPPLELSAKLLDLMEEANQAIGRLDGATLMLPNTNLFIYMFLRKEALLSSQIEGTQSSFSDLVLYETQQLPGVPKEDVEEVSNYVAAINHGIKRLQANFPLSLRLIKEIHTILLKGVRGQHKEPGEFRRSQNWIGGTRPGNARFVPPPPECVMDCMGALEKFLHDEPTRLPPLIKAALTHVQFETIHPFLDGNGRLGRLLITLILCAENVLQEPSLYLSLYFKIHRDKYYELLQEVREKGDWETWLEFFLTGVKETSQQAVITIKMLQQLFSNDQERISKLGRAATTALQIYNYLQKKPIISIQQTAQELASTIPTVTKAIEHLTQLNILQESTGQERNRLFAYKQYINILSEGAEPLIKK